MRRNQLIVELCGMRANLAGAKKASPAKAPKTPPAGLSYTPRIMFGTQNHIDARKRATRECTSRFGGGVALCP